MLGTYRYTLDGTDVSPEGDWTIVHEQNVGQIFFRRKLRGELTFRGADYDLIMASADCDVLEFKIYCGASEHWEGQFKFPYDFDIDEDSCVAVGEPEVVDEYSCIMDHYETEYTVTTLMPGATAVQLRDCAGVLLVAGIACDRLLTSTGGGGGAGVIDEIINAGGRMNCNLEIRSSFLNEDNFPNGDNYIAAYGTGNYITGAANRLDDLYIYTNNRARILMGGSPCDTGYITFQDLEELLRNWFNAYWYIDQNGAFRVEHIYFFDPAFPNSDFTVDINLKTLISSNGKSFAYRRNKYTYETGMLYDQELWSMQHYEGAEGSTVAVPVAHGIDFTGVPIFYGAAIDQKADCVPGVFKEKEFATARFWSDMQWAWDIAANPPNATPGSAQPDTIQCPGFSILDVDTGTMWVNCEVGALGAANVINGHLSIANLQDHYHQYDRIFLTGNMNSGAVVAFQTEIRKQLQESIEFTHCCSDNFDPMMYVRTELGDGKVKAATEKKRSVEVELLY